MFSCNHRLHTTGLSWGCLWTPHHEPRWIIYLSETFQESKNLKFDESILEIYFYLFTIRKSINVWALLISLNSEEYIVNVVLKVWHLDQQHSALPGSLSETGGGATICSLRKLSCRKFWCMLMFENNCFEGCFFCLF